MPTKHLVLATAGHIDHGKTELTKALTGIETDRLKEERERGITIDLGFAHTDLDAGRMLSIIDVPGHERFVRNMLAGVGGVDLALLVVAADESLMPQTREHLSILKLLGVRRGVVALTKADLVDAETLELVRLEVSESLEGSFLEAAPMLAVSSRTGDGIPELRRALEAAFDALEPRSEDGAFRLHLDRVFSVRGFGAVITGTVVSGRITQGAELEVTPEGLRAKVRGIEVHGQEVESARAGSRAALNLSGIQRESLRRGQQLIAPPGAFEPSQLFDVSIELLPDAPLLKDLARVHFHLGAEEVLARLKLLGAAGKLEPGQSGFAQARLEKPLVAWPGDRFIVRRYSPVTTIGGGRVLDNSPAKRRGRSEAPVAELSELESADPSRRLVLLARSLGQVALSELVRRTGRQRGDVERALEQLRTSESDVRVLPGNDPLVVHVRRWRELKERAVSEVSAFHDRESLRQGLSREELRERLKSGERGAEVVNAVLEELAAESRLRLAGELVALSQHRLSLKPEEQNLLDEIERSYRTAGLNPPTLKEIVDKWPQRKPLVDKLLHLLVRQAKLVGVTGTLNFHSSAIAALLVQLEPFVASAEPLSVPAFKELTGTSRKHAIPLLEYLDRQRVTRRSGNARIVLKAQI